jgi:uncharacterized membrane protein
MTDEKTASPEATDDMRVVAAQVADGTGVLAEGAVAAEGEHALIVARFGDDSAAMAKYQILLLDELAGSIHIDGVLVVKADEKGKLHVQKMTDHSTRTGLKWGIVGGVVAAVFLPATLAVGAITLGVAGAAAGKARNLYHRVEVEKTLADVITPGTSGILALVSAPAAEEVVRKMPEAQEVKTVRVDEETAGAIKAAAAAADKAAPVVTEEASPPAE